MKSILDPTFKYTPSVNTDIAKTFARIRRAQRQLAAAEMSPNVTVLNRKERVTRRAP